jgi:hypothetical protein
MLRQRVAVTCTLVGLKQYIGIVEERFSRDRFSLISPLQKVINWRGKDFSAPGALNDCLRVFVGAVEVDGAVIVPKALCTCRSRRGQSVGRI